MIQRDFQDGFLSRDTENGKFEFGKGVALGRLACYIGKRTKYGGVKVRSRGLEPRT